MTDKKCGTKDALAAFYKEKVDALSAEIRQLKKNNVAYIMAELFSFGPAVVAVVVYCVRDFSSQWLVAALAMLAVYAVVRKADVKNAAKIDRRMRLHAVYAKELKYRQATTLASAAEAGIKTPDTPSLSTWTCSAMIPFTTASTAL